MEMSSIKSSDTYIVFGLSQDLNAFLMMVNLQTLPPVFRDCVPLKY